MKRRQLIVTAAGGALSALLPAPALAGRPALLQRTLDHPPRCVRLANGTWTGFEIEASRMLCKRVGVSLLPMEEFIVWPRALRMITTGDIQLLPGVTWRQERSESMDFIGPYGVVEIYILVRNENAETRFETLDDFMVDDRVFTLASSAAIDPEFDERLKTDGAFAAHFIETVTSGSLRSLGLVQAMGYRVATRRVFGAITNWYSYRALQLMDPSELLFDPKELTAIKARMFGVAANYLTASLHVDAELRSDLRAAYRESRSDGSFEQIWREWYGDWQIPEPD